MALLTKLSVIAATAVTAAVGGVLSAAGSTSPAVAHAPAAFTLAGCECSPNSQIVVLGWRGLLPGTVLQVKRDSAVVYTGANPQGPAFNVYLPAQPLDAHGYTACTGTMTALGFSALACSSNTVTLTVN